MKHRSPKRRSRSKPNRPSSHGSSRDAHSARRSNRRPEPRSEDDRPEPRDRPGARARHSRELVRYTARVEKNRKGFAFLIFEGKGFEDLFVPERQAQALFHGDRVEVWATDGGDVQSFKVIDHRFKEIIGRYTPHPQGQSRGALLVYERKNAREEVLLPKGAPGAKPGDWIQAKLTFHEAGPMRVTGELMRVIGDEITAEYDVEMVAAEYGLVEEHPEEAEAEARAQRLEVPGRDLEGRTDLREVPFITIDGETARDFDDAVFVERKEKHYVLWVAIADVSHYVREGSALDRDARARSTSVYFPERAFHMLPRALSENLCSLRPREPRLAMTARIELSSDGRILDTKLYESVIESRRRATYNEIQAEYEKLGESPDWEFAPHFELYKILRARRIKRGSIDFELPEAEMRVDEKGEPISIENRIRQDAHRLIEEFMICANESVTEWMLKRKWPFVYRIHGAPSPESLSRFAQLASAMGIRIESEDEITPQTVAKIARKIESHPAATHLNMMLLRAMRQAVYSNVHDIHFGLASTAYTHFTSPIRRYPDLLVHRLLRWALRIEQKQEKRPTPGELAKIDEDLAPACDHASYRERLAADAERESIKLKQTRLMARHLGDEFSGAITGMVESGMFVMLDHPYVEGMIAKESLTDDWYEFNEERMIFYGRRKKRTFRIGDQVRVAVVRADIERRRIDFELRELGARKQDR